MLSALKDLLSSKKFLASLIGMVAFALGHWGIQIDESKTLELISPLIAFIIGQGIADHGKAIAAALPVATLVKDGAAPPSSTMGGGKAVIGLLAIASGLAVGHASVSMVSGCGRPLPVPVTDFIDCTKAEADAHWPEVLAKLTPDIGNWSKLAADVLALAPTYGLHIAECVGEELIAQYLSVAHQGAEASTHASHDAAEKIRASVSPPGKSATFITKLGKL